MLQLVAFLLTASFLTFVTLFWFTLPRVVVWVMDVYREWERRLNELHGEL